jgi:cell division transport system permease protein
MSSPDQAAPPEEAASELPAKAAKRDRLKALAIASQFLRPASLIPAASIAGRSLVMVIAIMTFLASLSAGTVWLIADASRAWTSAIAREATIQVKPRAGRNIEADVNEAAAIARRNAAIGEQSRALLSPWLGEALKASDLPVPRLVELSLSGKADLSGLRTELGAALPTATLDDHRPWLERLSGMANALVAIGLFVLALVLAATALAVGFATRGAMSGNREIISVLSLVGAEDRFIAREFQGHFLRLGLEGGLIGGLAAILTFFLGARLAGAGLGSAGTDQAEALFGSFSLGLGGHAIILLIVALIAGLAALVSRLTVFQNLRLNL